MVPSKRLELLTLWFVVKYSNPTELRGHFLEDPAGFEPTVRDLQSRALPTSLWIQRKIVYHTEVAFTTEFLKIRSVVAPVRSFKVTHVDAIFSPWEIRCDQICQLAGKAIIVFRRCFPINRNFDPPKGLIASAESPTAVILDSGPKPVLTLSRKKWNRFSEITFPFRFDRILDWNIGPDVDKRHLRYLREVFYHTNLLFSFIFFKVFFSTLNY